MTASLRDKYSLGEYKRNNALKGIYENDVRNIRQQRLTLQDTRSELMNQTLKDKRKTTQAMDKTYDEKKNEEMLSKKDRLTIRTKWYYTLLKNTNIEQPRSITTMKNRQLREEAEEMFSPQKMIKERREYI